MAIVAEMRSTTGSRCGIGNRRREHVGEPQRAVVAQEQHPGVEGAGNARREKAGTRDQVKTERAAIVDGKPGRRRPLAADHLGFSAGGHGR